MAYQYIDTTGTILADTSTIQASVEAEWKNALGADLVVTADTPQGVLITQEVQARSNAIANNATVANQINPNISGGVFLDAIAAWLGIDRPAATYTQVAGVVLTGINGTIIPAGVVAKTSAGDMFVSTGAATIGISGSVSVNFQAVNSGPIPCAANALTVIDASTAVLGWESVTNPNAGVVGKYQYSDAQFRTLRNNELAKQGNSTAAAIISGISALSGVSSMAYLENRADTAQTISGIAMAAHSVWACVQGGSNTDIGLILLEKTCGPGFNGATSVSVIEPYSGQSYTISFDRPTIIPILAQVTLSQGTSSANLLITAPQAILDFANGLIAGEPGFVVGANASPFDLAAAIANENPGVKVRSVQIAPASTGIFQNTEIAIAINQQASINLSSISVTIV